MRYCYSDLFSDWIYLSAIGVMVACHCHGIHCHIFYCAAILESVCMHVLLDVCMHVYSLIVLYCVLVIWFHSLGLTSHTNIVLLSG